MLNTMLHWSVAHVLYNGGSFTLQSDGCLYEKKKNLCKTSLSRQIQKIWSSYSKDYKNISRTTNKYAHIEGQIHCQSDLHASWEKYTSKTHESFVSRFNGYKSLRQGANLQYYTLWLPIPRYRSLHHPPPPLLLQPMEFRDHLSQMHLVGSEE